MRIHLVALLALILPCNMGCHTATQESSSKVDQVFSDFENRFLDAYWKQYPSSSIGVGYGKYYDNLTIPDSASFADNIAFSHRWLDSLTPLGYEGLSDNNKISFKIIKNQLESDIWYTAAFKPQQWDASSYNISGDCDYIINQPYAALEERLAILSRYLSHAGAYYRAALSNLLRPTKESVELAIMQNQGGQDVLGSSLADSIQASHLSQAQKDSLTGTASRAIQAMQGYVDSLKTIASSKTYVFRNFRIGGELFAAKFKYDLATDLTAEEMYKKASEDKQFYHAKMYSIADSLWSTYFPKQSKPKDSLQLVQLIMDKIQLNHARPADLFDSLTNQVHRIKKFIVTKDLFDFDTSSPPIVVRLMPVYARGVTIASAQFAPPYQKQGTTYFNIDDVTLYKPEKAESELREYNNFSSQYLTIHEAIPGHCLQGIYNKKKSPDVLRAVFSNGAMIEGWAVYCEGMMFENGWGNYAPEMQLVLYKWRLRELANVLVDYSMQCLNMPKDEVMNLLVKECFQTEAQAQEKYHRAMVSQVQLCCYYTGLTAIQSLREDYKRKMGEKFSLKDFHEKFLSFGSSPVKYIRERMLQ
jgi:uncharacterized protein (DUF885 family)